MYTLYSPFTVFKDLVFACLEATGPLSLLTTSQIPVV